MAFSILRPVLTAAILGAALLFGATQQAGAALVFDFSGTCGGPPDDCSAFGQGTGDSVSGVLVLDGIVPSPSGSFDETNFVSFSLTFDVSAVTIPFTAPFLSFIGIFDLAGTGIGTLDIITFDPATFAVSTFFANAGDTDTWNVVHGGDAAGVTGGFDPRGGDIPEPATMALLGSGLVVLGWRARRRRR